MPKLAPSTFRAAPVGTVLPDPALPGLRYQRRARGWTAQLRFKGARGWQSHGLGYLPAVDDVLDRLFSEWEDAHEGDDEAPAGVSFPPSVVLDAMLSPTRDKARELRRRLRDGEAPREGGLLFTTVADDYERRGFPNAGKPKKLAPRTVDEYRRQLARLRDAWHGRRLADLRKADVLKVLDALIDDGSPVEANRTLALVRKLFAWCVARDLLPASPAAGIAKPSEERPRDRTLTGEEIRQMWLACEALGPTFGPWAKLLLLTAARRDEAAKMRWDDIEGLDGPEPVWRVREKGGRLHLIPLAPMAVALLRSLPRSGEFLFSSGLTRGKESATQAPISGYSDAKERLDALAARLAAERRLGRPLAAGEKPTPADSLAPWRYHDLRRTVRTNLSRLRVQPHVAELVLGHAVTGLIKVYDVHDYLAEKRAALESWEAHLARMIEGAGNVVPMPGARGAA
jgi:integrase